MMRRFLLARLSISALLPIPAFASHACKPGCLCPGHARRARRASCKQTSRSPQGSCKDGQSASTSRYISARNLLRARGWRHFSCLPSPPAVDVPNYRLPAVLDIDVLHCDRLLAAVAVLAQGFHLGCEGARQFVECAFMGFELLNRLRTASKRDSRMAAI